MKTTLKSVLIVALIFVMAATMALPAFAYVPYNTYNYNFYGETVGSPAGYVPEKLLLAEDLGISAIHSPNDIYVDDSNNQIYLLDLGGVNARGRLSIFDENFNLISEFKYLTDINGEQYSLKNPCGVTTDKNGYIYICDTDNGALLKLTHEGQIIMKYEAPSDDIFDESNTYKPYKIVIGINGSAYVISKGCLEGILEFNPEGEFVRFFGAPKVQLSVGDYLQIYWRKIYRSFGGADVDDLFVTYVPTEFENIDIDHNGFIFSTVIANEKSTEEASKLNFTGTNTLNPTSKSTKKVNDTLSTNYGDLQVISKNHDNNFVDIVVDKDGFFSMLDTKLSKIFEYDSEGNLVFVYGGAGEQVGTFGNVSAMAKLGKKTLVIDKTSCAITVFKLSDYGEALHEAVNYYNLGLYAEADPAWRKVLLYNANSDLAHVGIGKVYYSNGEYKNSMEEFRLANDRENYSRSYALYRKEVIRANFTLGATLLVILFIALIIWRKYGKKIIAAIREKKNGGVING